MKSYIIAFIAACIEWAGLSVEFLSPIISGIRQALGLPAARAKNAESISIAPGRCIATFVASLTGESIAFDGSTFYNEEDLLGDPTDDTERGKRYVSATGENDVVIQSASRAGEREVKFLYGPQFDKLLSWGQRRTQPQFDFDFLFLYSTQSNEGQRIHRHKRCYFKKLPIIGIGRDKGYITATISYGDIAIVDPATGKEI